MLQEVQRIKQDELSSNSDEASCNIKGNEEDSHGFLNIDKADEPNKSRSLFWTQLLVCSILLWSLLFLKDSDYGKLYLSTITQVFMNNIEIEPVQQVINKLTMGIQQII